VLIIADERIAREVYAELFSMRGYSVATANDASSGLRAVLRRPRRFAIAVVALASGAGGLRRRLLRAQPELRVHVTVREQTPFDLYAQRAHQSLH
jgi:DNA-binding NtrC family response regulator